MNDNNDTDIKIVTVFFIIIMFVLSVSVSGCTTTEILPGLCYSDKDGTYICPEEEFDTTWIADTSLPSEYNYPFD